MEQLIEEYGISLILFIVGSVLLGGFGQIMSYI